MTFDDFGLNPDYNIYKGVENTIVPDGCEYAANTIEPNSAVFVVDRCGNTIFFTRPEDSDDNHKSKPHLTGHYIDADGSCKKTEDYRIIGEWMLAMLNEFHVLNYGVVVENLDGSYQVLNQ